VSGAGRDVFANLFKDAVGGNDFHFFFAEVGAKVNHEAIVVRGVEEFVKDFGVKEDVGVKNEAAVYAEIFGEP
jgi:hypothetical protein